MLVDREAWHCRVYRWWYRHKYARRGDKTFSNLCPYMRAVMFWAPMRALFSNWITLFTVRGKKVPLCVVTWPIFLYATPKLLGYASWNVKMGIWTVYIILSSMALLIAIGVGISYLFKPEGLGWGAKVGDAAEPVLKRGASFHQLLSEFLRSAHDRVCPEVTFIKEQ